MAIDEAGLPTATRFWKRVIKTEGCWLWTGHVSGGYGRIRVDGSRVQVHVYAYELLTGDKVPPGLVVDHRCNNKICVNPGHLEPKTQRENILRSSAPSAVAARTGLCDQGHSLEDAYVRPNGKRECRPCRRETRKRYRLANRDRINEHKRKKYAEMKG